MTCTANPGRGRIRHRRIRGRGWRGVRLQGVVTGRGGEYGRGEPLVVGGRDGAQVEQQPAALDPADDRGHVAAAHRRTRPQLRRQLLGK